MVGAALIGLDLALHVYGRALGAGIGLALASLLAWLFAQRLDGPLLYYRRWGWAQRVSLTSVTAVSTGKRRSGRSLLLTSPDSGKPVRVVLQSGSYVMSPAAREHLRWWLSASQAQWTPQAAALLEGDHTNAAAPGRRRLWLAVVCAVLTSAGASIGVWLLDHHNDSRFPISGAPGYSTFAGPHGKPLPVGRPWGRPCQPVRFTVEEHVPDWVYDQVAAVVNQAGRDGIDVTLETRQFFWTPTSLYYLDGQTPASTERVAIFTQSHPPPTFSNGQPERINLGWNTRLDPDGHNEDLTLAQGILWMRALNDSPPLVRRAIRQLIAMTQGIISTSQPTSAITDTSEVDQFTAADIAAMQRMSGCDKAANGGLPNSP